MCGACMAQRHGMAPAGTHRGDGVGAAKADAGSTAASGGGSGSTPCEAELIRFSDAVHERAKDEISAARAALRAALGEGADGGGGDDAAGFASAPKLVDAAAVVAFFNGMADRIADGTCLQVE